MTTEKKPKKQAKKLPSDETIKASKKDLSKMLKDLLSGNTTLPSKRETITDKLKLIGDILKPLQSEIEGRKLKYTDIEKAIEMKLDLKVSASTLRIFCQNHLGFKKSERKKTVKKEPIRNVEIEEAIEDNKNFDAIKELSSIKIDFE